jgi:hypothetical protein
LSKNSSVTKNGLITEEAHYLERGQHSLKRVGQRTCEERDAALLRRVQLAQEEDGSQPGPVLVS